MSKDYDWIEDYIGIVFSAFIMVLLLSVFLFSIVFIPVVLVACGLYYFLYASPSAREKRASKFTQELYQKTIAEVEIPEIVEFGLEIYNKLPELPEELKDVLLQIIVALYKAEGFDDGVKEPPAICDSVEGARYRDYLSRIERVTNEIMLIKMAIELSFKRLLEALPPLGSSSRLNTKIVDLPNVTEVIDAIVIPYLVDEADGVFKEIRKTLELNREYAEENGIGNSNAELVHTLLRDTPFLDLFTLSVPVSISNEVRFEHSWCIAPPGTGKTQLIQHMVSLDLDLVAENKASVIVMDSAGDLIENISRLKIFSEGQPLHGKLIVIRPDAEYPPALNMFDMGRDRLDSYKTDDREELVNSVIDQLTYVLDAIGGESAAKSAKQETLYRYIIRLLMVIPDATLETFTDLLQTKDVSAYQAELESLPKAVQDFFHTQFASREFKDTKVQLAWRLSLLRENTLFDRMFAHPKSKLDLFTELNESKVILIHTDMQRLKEQGTNVFGRYFIGSLLAAAQERASQARAKRMPVYAYIDEAQDYIADDTKISRLIDQARKMRIGMFLAHQRTKQINDANVLDALVNTATKFASTDNPNDLPILSKAMRCSSDEIATQPDRHFMVSVRRVASPFSFEVPFFVLENMEKASDKDLAELTDVMREKYCSYHLEAGNKQLAEETTASDASEEEIKPTKWD